MSDDETPIVASHNAETVAQVQRHPWVRHAALFLGESEDVVDRPFGPGLPSIPAWVAERVESPGYVCRASARRRRAPTARRSSSRPSAALRAGRRCCGACSTPFALLRRDVREARLLAVCGPRALTGFVEDLPQRLAGCDLAVVQGGLATTMEILAARRPFVWVPLREHCERRCRAPEPKERHATHP